MSKKTNPAVSPSPDRVFPVSWLVAALIREPI
jgi:hypothetical protein